MDTFEDIKVGDEVGVRYRNRIKTLMGVRYGNKIETMKCTGVSMMMFHVSDGKTHHRFWFNGSVTIQFRYGYYPPRAVSLNGEDRERE